MKDRFDSPKTKFFLGNLIAKSLAGSWRQSPPPLELSPRELSFVTPSLLQTGAAALASQRLRSIKESGPEEVSELQQAYRLYTLQALRMERDLVQVLELLRADNIDPILVKGWAMARHYPQTGLRPYGDIDLCVNPADYDRAKWVLKSDAGKYFNVDLHRGFRTLDHHSWQDLRARSIEVELNGAGIRILNAEDHLRVLCFHFLREGAWRSLWLCDIAVAVESRARDFDWKLFLGANAKRARWVASVIVLARRLLDARFEGVPDEIATTQLPHWFLPCVLREWEAPSMPRRHLTPMTTAWRTPLHALKGLRSHWPNAVEGTIGVSGSFNELPRLPFQLSNCVVRSFDYFRRLLAMS